MGNEQGRFYWRAGHRATGPGHSASADQAFHLHAVRQPGDQGVSSAGRGPDGVFHVMDSAGFALCHVRGLTAPLDGPAVHVLTVPQARRCARRWAWPGTGGTGRPIGPMPPNWPGDSPPDWYMWWWLFDQQGGLCALCLNPPHVIDHDHVTGLIRGLLCWRCNSLEPFCCFPAYIAAPPAGPRRWLHHSARHRR